MNFPAVKTASNAAIALTILFIGPSFAATQQEMADAAAARGRAQELRKTCDKLVGRDKTACLKDATGAEAIADAKERALKK